MTADSERQLALPVEPRAKALPLRQDADAVPWAGFAANDNECPCEPEAS